MISRDVLFKLWSLNNYQATIEGPYLFYRNGVVSIIDDPKILLKIKKLRKKYRQYRKDHCRNHTLYKSISAMSDEIAFAIMEMWATYIPKWEANRKREIEQKRSEEVPDKHIVYAITYQGRYLRGMYEGTRPNIFWNKKTAISELKRWRANISHINSDLHLVEIDVCKTGREVHVE